jgi:outer membrane lipoprotein-sorting protein
VKKYFSLTIFVLLVIQFTGCTTTQTVQQERIISADRIIKRIEANRRKVKSFEGTGSISIKTADLDTKSSFKVEIKRPDSLKVSFFGPFGIDLAFALISPKDFSFYDAINNQLYTGKVRPGIMKNVMKIDIPFEELIDAVTGSVNLTSKLKIEPLARQINESEYELVYKDSLNNKLTKISIDSESFKILQLTLTDLTGKLNYQADYHDFTKVDEVQIPFLININDIANNQKLKIEYRHVDINKLTEILKLEIPDDAKINKL